MSWKNKIYTCLWASNHCKDEREENDYYATDPATVDDLLKLEEFQNKIREPACWEWHISKKLVEAWYTVTSSDLIDRWYGIWWVDFLKTTKQWNGDIISNPPYKYAQEFIEHSIDVMTKWSKIAMFLKLTFLEWQKRKKMFKEHPPKVVNVYSKRAMCWKNWVFVDKKWKKISNAVAYCWYIWEVWYTWDTIVKWI